MEATFWDASGGPGLQYICPDFNFGFGDGSVESGLWDALSGLGMRWELPIFNFGLDDTSIDAAFWDELVDRWMEYKLADCGFGFLREERNFEDWLAIADGVLGGSFFGFIMLASLTIFLGVAETTFAETTCADRAELLARCCGRVLARSSKRESESDKPERSERIRSSVARRSMAGGDGQGPGEERGNG